MKPVLRIVLLPCLLLALRVPAVEPPDLEYGPETTVISEPRFENGRINYIEALNQRLSDGVTLENNAAVEILLTMSDAYFGLQDEWRDEALDRLRAEHDPDHPIFIPFEDFVGEENNGDPTGAAEQLEAAEKQPWTDDRYPVVVRWIEANQNALEILAGAAHKKRFYVPLVVPDNRDSVLTGLRLPHLAHLRNVASALRARANRSIGLGDIDAAWSDILTLKRLGRRVADEAILISHLVGRWIDSQSSEVIYVLANARNLSSEDARRLGREIAAIPSFPPMTEAMALGDRFMVLDLAQRSLKSWLPGALFPPDEFDDRTIDLLSRHYDPNVHLRALNAEYDRAMEAFEMQQYADAAEHLEDQYEAWQQVHARFTNFLERLPLAKPTVLTRERVSRGFLPLLMPSFRGANDVKWAIRTNHDLERIALALAAHRIDYGRYPESLNALAPEYIDSIPEDHFNNQSLHYELTKEGIARVWSVGADLEENGGDPTNDVIFQLD